MEGGRGTGSGGGAPRCGGNRSAGHRLPTLGEEREGPTSQSHYPHAYGSRCHAPGGGGEREREDGTHDLRRPPLLLVFAGEGKVRSRQAPRI
jgi:hypothetical protein